MSIRDEGLDIEKGANISGEDFQRQSCGSLESREPNVSHYPYLNNYLRLLGAPKVASPQAKQLYDRMCCVILCDKLRFFGTARAEASDSGGPLYASTPQSSTRTSKP